MRPPWLRPSWPSAQASAAGTLQAVRETSVALFREGGGNDQGHRMLAQLEQRDDAASRLLSCFGGEHPQDEERSGAGCQARAETLGVADIVGAWPQAARPSGRLSATPIMLT